jgi:transposase
MRLGNLGLDEQAMLLRALEDKRFTPFGGDREVSSNFQLIAGTNRELQAAVKEGRFREDLLARTNLWTFPLPGLRQRPEDIEPNLDYELDQFARKSSLRVTMSTEVREAFLKFAQSPAAKWSANFRDLNACITRMATLSAGGRITAGVLTEEIERLKAGWSAPTADGDHEAVLVSVLSEQRRAQLDLFDQAQLAFVIQICRGSATLSDAGRKLFAATRENRKTANDADRLRKYLARFDVDWQTPYLTLMKEDAPQREHSLREVFNGLRWFVRAGCPWRMLPNDLPPWHAVQQQTQRWLRAGCFESIVADLRLLLRVLAERTDAPSAAILDSRTLQSTPESGGRAGYDGAKKRKGSKVHAAVDTLGHLLALKVTAANEQDRAQVAELAQALQAATGDHVQVAFVDQGYTGAEPATAAARHGVHLEVVKHHEAKRGFVLLPRRWVVERSFAWAARFRRLARDYERLATTLAGYHWLAFAMLMLKSLFAKSA